jgi:hypothetical protein
MLSAQWAALEKTGLHCLRFRLLGRALLTTKKPMKASAKIAGGTSGSSRSIPSVWGFNFVQYAVASGSE